ncbi:MAG: hypothetical protein M1819_003301 [Sarea resinae]|nr:MAG: hypothetical protein M1819_003301 [Sarea resinae]
MRPGNWQAHSSNRPDPLDELYGLSPPSRTQTFWPAQGVYDEPVIASGRQSDATISREYPNIMGQGASSRREESLQSDAGPDAQMNQEGHAAYPNDAPASSNTVGELPRPGSRPGQFTNGVGMAGLDDASSWGTEGEGIEGLEENSLYGAPQGSLRNSSTEDVEMLDAPPLSSSSRTPSRASSYFSRFSPRWAPRSASPYAEGSDDSSRQGRVTRRRLSNSVASSPHGQDSQTSLPRRFGTFGPLSNGNSSSTLSRRRRNLGSISRPIPHSSQDEIRSSRSGWPQPIEPTASSAGPPLYHSSFPRRTSRLSRLRDTLPMPFPNIFSSGSSSRPASDSQSPARPQRPSRSGLAESSESFVPQLPLPDFALDDGGGLVRPPFLSGNSNLENNRPVEDSSEPTTSRTDRDMRRLPDILRRRNTRGRPGEDQAAMLTRLLSVAAAATAASLIGHRDRNLFGAQGGSIDGPDGSFEGFLQDIRNGRLTSALRSGSNDTGTGTTSPTADGAVAPFNFIRMFRFDSSDQTGRQANGSSAVADSQRSNDEETFNGPMVPVIIVGIRSVTPSNTAGGDDGSNTPPFIEALSNLTPAPAAAQRGNSSGGLLRRPEGGRTIFGHRRRASMGGSSTFPANYDSQRHQRSPELSRSRLEGAPVETPTLPPLVSDPPPGPRPPPSTPLGLSTNTSGSTTPSRRPSSASAGYSQHFSRRSTAMDFGAQESQSDANTARQRRRSDSEFARHGDLGSGASRRNGVVEPDNRTPDGPRSWIIYVLGGSYPEDHPILTTPSLFTDNPSYEDMLLLSSLLGPVKPPVASEADVAAASGTYQVRGEYATGALTAIDASSNESFPICSGERCLVCLGDYVLSEDLRKLTGCGHFFHKECIDQWLTTGRNSCPLCRGKGVDESAKRAASDTPVEDTVPPLVS